jgi:hypothetical protein
MLNSGRDQDHRRGVSFPAPAGKSAGSSSPVRSLSNFRGGLQSRAALARHARHRRHTKTHDGAGELFTSFKPPHSLMYASGEILSPQPTLRPHHTPRDHPIRGLFRVQDTPAFSDRTKPVQNHERQALGDAVVCDVPGPRSRCGATRPSAATFAFAVGPKAGLSLFLLDRL